MLILLRLVMNFLTSQCFIGKYQLILSKMKLVSRTSTFQQDNMRRTCIYSRKELSGHSSLSRISRWITAHELDIQETPSLDPLPITNTNQQAARELFLTSMIYSLWKAAKESDSLWWGSENNFFFFFASKVWWGRKNQFILCLVYFTLREMLF